jgi:UDP-2-acetamido-2,6-beta-L-arabino-hexul-4-ose reductase
MRIAVTGAAGFLGWHLRVALAAHGQHEVVTVGREEFRSPETLSTAIRHCDAVVHLAGVNRGAEAYVEEGNRALADTLVAALPGTGVRIVVHGNSIHSGSDSAFGRSKAYVADHLASACAGAGWEYTDVLLPNVFGGGGRPHYNSFVATFCHELAAGRRPTVLVDRELDLLHAQDAADVLIAAVERRETGVLRPRGEDTSVGDVLRELEAMLPYRDAGVFPDLSSPYRVALFSTFQAACFPARFPFVCQLHTDDRGTLYEASRAQATDTLTFVSSTAPGHVRGQHFHRRKIERFLVVDGEAEICLTRVGGDECIVFRVSGEQPIAVDMPPLWAHSLKNTGDRDVTTVFWTNELLNPADPDTYRHPVYPEEPRS